jgi:hypothetical protein
MRITAIEIENFKGISERVRVDLKPITLLFGANSAGKSTILQALLYMKDVLDRRNLDAISTPVSGRALDLGGFRSFVHGQDLSRTIRIRVHMKLTGEELPTMAPKYERPTRLSDAARKFVDELLQKQTDVWQSVHSATVGIEVKWDDAEKLPVASAYTVGLNSGGFVRIKRGVKQVKFCDEDNSLVLEDEDQAPLHERGLSVYEVSPCFEGSVSAFEGIRNWLQTPLDPIPDFSPRVSLKLPKACANSYTNESGKPMNYSVAEMLAWEGTELLARLIIGPGKLLQDWLQGLRHVGPLRALLPRKGIASAELSDWYEGLAAWKTLGDENTSQNLIDDINQWLVGQDRLNSGYGLERRLLAQVDVDAFRNAVDGDLDRAQLLELLKEAPKCAEFKLVEARSGLRLDPSDVGVGISQVLPIVVGAVAPGGSVVAIEQPELHIHPAMQVALGDLFIEGAVQRGMSFLIETHSEHLMLRLLRRIRETTEGELSGGSFELSPDDVSVVYVQSGAKGVEMLPLPIDETGEFSTRWPKGFFDERAEELFG